MSPQKFRQIVWKYHEDFGRHGLPWRKTRDPYRILVSEVMLQQTQVDRVKPFYENWLKKFPTAKALASAPLSEVLKAWQGLGYNSRGKRLWEAGKLIAQEGFPKSAEGLQKLPGVGPYTARAVMAFAHNTDEVFIETNIRTAVLYHFFPNRKEVGDAELLAVLAKTLPKGQAREWYAALMDYGAALKRQGVRLNTKAKGYTKQTKFAGSPREARGALLKELAHGGATLERLSALLGDYRKEQMAEQLSKLCQEGMVKKVRARYTLP